MRNKQTKNWETKKKPKNGKKCQRNISIKKYQLPQVLREGGPGGGGGGGVVRKSGLKQVDGDLLNKPSA